jgi:hypothetical protein
VTPPIDSPVLVGQKELVTGEGDKPAEVGRAAMGVIYKAFDIDLHSVSGLRTSC